jgi:hypothetical protein
MVPRIKQLKKKGIKMTTMALRLSLIAFAGVFAIPVLAAASVFDSIKSWQGEWRLQGTPACAKSDVAEDALFRKFMEDYSWTFSDEGDLVESLRVAGCEGKFTYKVEFLPATKEGPTGFMSRMKLTRTATDTKCLRANVRPAEVTLSYIAYPEFFEVYEPMLAADGPCPGGDHYVMQFHRQVGPLPVPGSPDATRRRQ